VSNDGERAPLLDEDHQPGYNSAQVSNSDARAEDAPSTFRALLTPKIIKTMSVYAVLAFIEMGAQVLQPLVYSTSPKYGGLGFDPYMIGIIMGVWGVTNAVLQVAFLGSVIRKIGAKMLLLLSFVSYMTVFALYPLLRSLARAAEGSDTKVWAVLFLQLGLSMTNIAAYG
jgi:hypothetical protein